MTPTARRILAAAAQHRRQKCTQRWAAHHAEVTDRAAGEALTELVSLGHAKNLRRGENALFGLTPPLKRT